MELSITQQKENPLLSRTEVLGKLTFEQSTPSNSEVQKSLASKLKVNEQLIVIKKIGTTFGSRTASLNVFVYKDETSLNRIEPPLGKKAAEKKAKLAEASKKAEDAKQESASKQESA